MPPFYQLLDYTFQDLCRDLFHQETKAISTTHFGVRGDPQLGVDIVSNLPNGRDIDVAQCKAYKSYPPAKIKEACKDFIKHKKHWKKRRAKRFVLIVGCAVESRGQLDEIEAQKKYLRRHGFEFDLWAAANLRDKLKPHIEIVNRYCFPSAYWLNDICGPAVSPVPTSSSSAQVIVNAALVGQVEQLSKYLAAKTGKELDLSRSKLREGKRAEALAWVNEVKGDSTVWNNLAPADKSRIMRFEASFLLDTEAPLEKVKELADEAHKICPEENESRLRALIAYHGGDKAKAIEILKDQTDVDSINLRSALLLETGNMDGCLAAIEKVSAETSTAETYRVRALAAFLKKDLLSASVHIQKAMDLSPTWKAVRFSFAAISYHWGLAPAALIGRYTAWPDPIIWLLVRKDQAGIEKTKQAIEIFRKLANEEEDAQEKLRYQIWLMASLLNSPDGQTEGAELCRTLVLANPENPHLAGWIGIRNLKVDVNAIVAALQAKPETAQTILVMIGYFHLRKDYAKALELLEQKKGLFSDDLLTISWKYWHAQTLIAEGRPADALKDLEGEIDHNLKRIKLTALDVLAQKNSKDRSAIDYAKSIFEETKDPEWFYNYANLLREGKEWKELAGVAEALVSTFQTVHSLYLAVEATFRAEKHELCLKLIGIGQSFFADSKLPSDLRRTKTGCYRALGIVPTAVSEAEELVADDPSTENLVNLAAIYLDMADLKSLNVVARRLSERDDLENSTRLNLANVLTAEDPATSKKLWNDLDPATLADDEITAAISVGHQLGDEKHTPKLIHRMQGLAREGKGGVSMHSMEEILELVKTNVDRHSKTNKLYREGQLPIHFLISGLHSDFASVYHSAVERNLKLVHGDVGSPLFFMHGGRGDASSVVVRKSSPRLVMDISSVLFAKQFGFLEEVHAAFGSIFISPILPKLLIRTREKHLHPQPARIQSQRLVLDLFERNKIQSLERATSQEDSEAEAKYGKHFLSTLRTGESHGCLVTDFYPPSKGIDQRVNESDLKTIATKLATCRGVADSLLNRGLLSQSQYDQIIDRLGTVSSSADFVGAPAIGAKLFLAGTIPEIMAGAGMLEIVCESFKVSIETSEVESIRQALRANDAEKKTADWVSEIIEDVSTGLSSEKFKLFQIGDLEEGEKNEDVENMERMALRDMLHFSQATDDLIIADDRFLNSFSASGKAPILSSYDLLKGIVEKGKLAKARFYHLLQSFRAAKVLYIPIEADEVYFYLQQSMGAGGFKESKELSVIRQYVSFCLTQADGFQRPPRPPGSPNMNGELAIAMNMKKISENVLGQIWKDESTTVDSKVAMSSWALRALYVGSTGVRAALGVGATSNDGRKLSALDLANFYTQSVLISNEEKGSKPGLRSEFVKWISSELINPKLASDPHLADQISSFFKEHMSFDRSKASSDPKTRGMVLAVLQIMNELPEPIVKGLQQDPGFMEKLGFQVQSILSIKGNSFSASAFWDMASEAIANGVAKLKPVQGKGEIEFRKQVDANCAIGLAFDNPITKRTEVVCLEEFEFLYGDSAHLRLALKKRRHWVDASQGEISKVESDLLVATKPHQRVDILHKLRKSSGAEYYLGLSDRASELGAIEFSRLVPDDIQVLTKHVRLHEAAWAERPPAERMDRAVKLLLEEPNLPTALNIMAGMPIGIPDAIFERLDKVGKTERRKVFRVLLRSKVGPIAIGHLVKLLLRFQGDSPHYSHLAKRLLRGLVSAEGLSQMKAYKAVQKWIFNEISSLPHSQKISALDLLAVVWTHTSKVYSLMRSFGLDDKWMQREFGRRTGVLTSEVLDRRDSVYWDILHPRIMDEEQVTFYMVKSILDGAGSPQDFDFLREALSEMVFFKADDGQLLPRVPFLRNVQLLGNAAGSYFGAELTEGSESCLGADFSLKISTKFKGDVLKASLENVINPKEGAASGWYSVFSILGDIRPPDELKEPLLEALNKVDILSLMREALVNSAALLRQATAQAVHLKVPTLTRHLESELKKATQYLAETGSHKKLDERLSNILASSLLEAAMHLAIADPGESGSPSRFVELSEEIANLIPTARDALRALFLQLSFESPPKDEHVYWTALLKIRRC